MAYVTGEACPHHVTLTDQCLRTFDSNYKMAPPLRTQADIDAIVAGLKDGTLEVIATDHAPHAPEKKARELDQAPNGIIGLETLVPICIKSLIEPGHLTWPQLIEKLTINPAKVLGIEQGTLQPGGDADLTIIHPTSTRTVSPSTMETNADWSPYDGWSLAGFARTTLSRGEVIVDEYAVVGREGRGQWLPRTTAGLQAQHTPPPTPTPPVPPAKSRQRTPRPAGAR